MQPFDNVRVGFTLAISLRVQSGIPSRRKSSSKRACVCASKLSFAGGMTTMKCTNCGNDNPATLWDEGDTIYCSVCTHRTRKTDFEDDSVQCPYCHRLRDKKAMYCRYCNSSDWTPSSPAEFAEIDKILKDMGY